MYAFPPKTLVVIIACVGLVWKRISYLSGGHSTGPTTEATSASSEVASTFTLLGTRPLLPYYRLIIIQKPLIFSV